MGILDIFTLFNWSTVLVGIIVLLVGSWVMLTEPWLHLPPGPPALPIIGSLPFLGDTDPRKAFQKLATKYGDIFTIYFGHNRAIVITGYENICDALVKSGNSFIGRPYICSVDVSHKQKGIGLNQGHPWQLQRRFVLHQLKHFGLGKRTMTDLVQIESEHLTDEIRSLSKMNKPFHPAPILQLAALNLISQIAFGIRADYHDSERLEYVAVAKTFLNLSGSDCLFNIFPYLRHLPGNLVNFRSFKECVSFMRSTYMKIISDHAEKIRNGETPDDVVGAYIVEMEKQRKDGQPVFSEEELYGIISDLSLGGSDTSGNTLSWAILYMTLYPHIQERVHHEILSVIGADQMPSMEDRSKLPLVEAVLAEVMRLKNVLPLSVPHSPMEDVTFKGYTIPKGTMVITSHYSVDLDPNVWENPEQFNPDRFIGEHGQYVTKEEQITFSMGKRVCLGESLARMEMFVFFTSLMQKFRFQLPKDEPEPDMDGRVGFTYDPFPYRTIVECRF